MVVRGAPGWEAEEGVPAALGGGAGTAELARAEEQEHPQGTRARRCGRVERKMLCRLLSKVPWVSAAHLGAPEWKQLSLFLFLVHSVCQHERKLPGLGRKASFQESAFVK